jgi:hypothetical protein
VLTKRIGTDFSVGFVYNSLILFLKTIFQQRCPVCSVTLDQTQMIGSVSVRVQLAGTFGGEGGT